MPLGILMPLASGKTPLNVTYNGNAAVNGTWRIPDHLNLVGSLLIAIPTVTTYGNRSDSQTRVAQTPAGWNHAGNGVSLGRRDVGGEGHQRDYDYYRNYTGVWWKIMTASDFGSSPAFYNAGGNLGTGMAWYSYRMQGASRVILTEFQFGAEDQSRWFSTNQSGTSVFAGSSSGTRGRDANPWLNHLDFWPSGYTGIAATSQVYRGGYPQFQLRGEVQTYDNGACAGAWFRIE